MEKIKLNIEKLLEVDLIDETSFSKVRETLTRIGVGAKDGRFWQSCHILHKRRKYYIVHFKELYELDGKETNIDEIDLARRNKIASMLEDWGLVKILSEVKSTVEIPKNAIKIIPFREKGSWEMCSKYKIGRKK